MRGPAQILAVAGLSLMLMAGCTVTQKDFDDLTATVNRLSTQMTAQQAQAADLAEQIKNLREQVRLGDARVDRRLGAVSDASGDMRLELDQLRSELARLTNKVELSDQAGGVNPETREAMEGELGFIKRRLDRLETALSLSPLDQTGQAVQGAGVESAGAEASSTAAEEGPEEFYQQIDALFKKRQYEEAAALYAQFLERYPTHALAPSAQFFLGECRYFQREYEDAIFEYDKVIKQYPRSDRVSNALLKQGFAFYNIGDKTTATLLLKQLVSQYPDSYSAGVAKKRLQTLE